MTSFCLGYLTRVHLHSLYITYIVCNHQVIELSAARASLVQIYVEVPRARLTLELARIKEADGDIASAATILQELQVNQYTTYSTVYMCLSSSAGRAFCLECGVS